jgi:hypothetical protein
VATRMLIVSRVGISRELEARLWAESITEVWESRKEGARARGWSLRTPYIAVGRETVLFLETLGSGLFGRAICVESSHPRDTPGVLKGPLFNSAGESGRTGAFDEGARWRPGGLFDSPD